MRTPKDDDDADADNDDDDDDDGDDRNEEALVRSAVRRLTLVLAAEKQRLLILADKDAQRDDESTPMNA